MRNPAILVVLFAVATEAGAAAAVIHVPADAPTVQAAVTQASDGDVIEVSAGRWCGATIDREVHLLGRPGATIIGCAAPTDFGGLRLGFVLADAGASGTSIVGFRFDGLGISTTNTAPLALAILGRDAHGVIVAGNRIDGTVQGITNSGGDGWLVLGNRIHDLTIFGCVDPDGRCGGGDGIVVQERDAGADRATGNKVLLNDVEGAIPDGLSLVGLTAIFVLGQDHPLVAANRVAIPHNTNAPATGIGVQVSDVCCGEPTPFLTTRHAVIVDNDGRGSEIAVEVDPDASGGCGNSDTAIIHRNLGVVIVCGVQQKALAAARARVVTTYR
jgi:hypothetical protein